MYVISINVEDNFQENKIVLKVVIQYNILFSWLFFGKKHKKNRKLKDH
jgi:hypothetical protein